MTAADLLGRLESRCDVVILSPSRAGLHSATLCLSGDDAPRVTAYGGSLLDAVLVALGESPSRPCAACGMSLPLAVFGRWRTGAAADGLARRCRPCERERVREAKRRRREAGGALRPPDPGGPPRECLACGRLKPASDFCRRARSPTGRCRNCKACERAKWGCRRVP